MLGIGGLVGLLACWLDGWSPARHWRVDQAGGDMVVRLFPNKVAVEATYFCYYALAFFVLSVALVYGFEKLRGPQ
jgi:hypothetical protein